MVRTVNHFMVGMCIWDVTEEERVHLAHTQALGMKENKQANRSSVLPKAVC